jgi:hypothetical protein
MIDLQGLWNVFHFEKCASFFRSNILHDFMLILTYFSLILQVISDILQIQSVLMAFAF